MEVDEFIPTLAHATERDIDLLLVEELHASPPFVRWFAARAGLGAIQASTVLHSKRRTRSRREIDIFVDIILESSRRAALLIENKLDATEQPDQAESYRTELDVLACSHAERAMAIVCPASYAWTHSAFVEKFDVIVSYEELADYFADGARRGGEEASRMDFRARLLRQAVVKHRRGYTPVPTQKIGGFNARYVGLLGEVAPEIKPGPSMLKIANPDESVSMIFDHRACFGDLPDAVRPTRFSHELGRGQDSRANYVAVTFGGWGAALPSIRELLEAEVVDLGATLHAKPPTKVRPRPGLVMCLATPAVDNQGCFDGQQHLIREGIAQARRLRSWLIANRSLLPEWRRRVEGAGANL